VCAVLITLPDPLLYYSLDPHLELEDCDTTHRLRSMTALLLTVRDSHRPRLPPTKHKSRCKNTVTFSRSSIHIDPLACKMHTLTTGTVSVSADCARSLGRRYHRECRIHKAPDVGWMTGTSRTRRNARCMELFDVCVLDNSSRLLAGIC